MLQSLNEGFGDAILRGEKISVAEKSLWCVGAVTTSANQAEASSFAVYGGITLGQKKFAAVTVHFRVAANGLLEVADRSGKVAQLHFALAAKIEGARRIRPGGNGAVEGFASLCVAALIPVEFAGFFEVCDGGIFAGSGFGSGNA